jgi:hypothetical protein
MTGPITVKKNTERGTYAVVKAGTVLPLLAGLKSREEANAWRDFYREQESRK